MLISDHIEKLKEKYNVLDVIDCDSYAPTQPELYSHIKQNHKEAFENNDRIIITLSRDYYNHHSNNLMLQSIQKIINDIDISNFFVTIVTTNINIKEEYQWILENISIDNVPFQLISADGDYEYTNNEDYTVYRSFGAIELPEDLTDKERHLFLDSKVFCILPWISQYTITDGKVKPCCNYKESIGNTRTHSLEDIWNNEKTKQLRLDLLNDVKVKQCERCYIREQTYNDQTNFRISYNKKFIDQRKLLEQTNNDGSLDTHHLKLVYYKHDNLCNLTCRMCNSTYSSSLYKVEKDLGILNRDGKARLQNGRHNTDLYEQLTDQADHIQQLIFEGGEPLMNSQSYDYIELLNKKQKHDVELHVVTNMTHNSLKDRNFLDLTEQFKTMSIYGSLDAEGKRAEYLRNGTQWDKVLAFRQEMKQKRKDIFFCIHNTLTIINVLHSPDFHKSWVEKGLVDPGNFYINTLFEPKYLQVENAPEELKQLIREKYTKHIKWLRPLDRNGKSISGYESVLDTIDNNNKFDGELFWNEIDKLDNYYNQNLLEYFPELEMLTKYRKPSRIINTVTN